jgi:GT2 family glycosyltransferase
MNPLSKTTAIIKTFQRPNDLDRLIRSIRRFYPGLPILVGDDGLVPSPRSDVGYIRLPQDIGVSAGRNALLERIETPYFVLLEDDFEFCRRTNIEKLARLVDEEELDIAAGDCFRVKRKLIFLRRKRRPYHGLFQFQSHELRLVYGDHGRRNGYLLCDVAYNFYVARTDTIRAMGAWDADLRQNEHTEFFVRAKRHGLRVGYCSDVVIWHWNSRPPGYGAYRFRSYHHLAAQKIGVDRIIGFQGQEYACDGPATIPMPTHLPKRLVVPIARAA